MLTKDVTMKDEVIGLMAIKSAVHGNDPKSSIKTFNFFEKKDSVSSANSVSIITATEGLTTRWNESWRKNCVYSCDS